MISAPPRTYTADDIIPRPAGGRPAPKHAPAVRRRPPRQPRTPGILVAAMAFSALVALYLALSVHAFVPNSDGATVLLEGAALAKGNWLLHGWILSLDSFWTSDVLFYAGAFSFAGLRPVLMSAVPAFIAALVVVAGILIARDGWRRRSAGTAGAATVVVLLAFPSHAFARFFLSGPLHITTALLALVAFYALRRNTFGWGFLVAIVAIVAGMLGDDLMVAYAVVPIILAGAVGALRRRNWRAGAPAVVAASIGALGAETIQKFSRLIGSFTLNPHHPVASPHQLVTNLHLLPTFEAALLGLQTRLYSNGGDPPLWQAAHLLGALVVVSAVVGAVLRLFGGIWARVPAPVPLRRADWWFDDVLVFACAGPPITFIVLASSSSNDFGRYLAPGVIFAIVLAGRMVARLWTYARSSAVEGVAACALSVIAAYGIISVGLNLTQPIPSNSATQLVAALHARDLTSGVGDYWDASIVTVESQGESTVRPVLSSLSGQLIRYPHQSSAAWYDGKKFQFFVYNATVSYGSVDTATATDTWGPPQRIERVGQYDILTWDHPITVSMTASPSRA